jgi:predicted N-formylglutamate amidohydrolase
MPSAVEIYRATKPAPRADFVFTCEHASNALPEHVSVNGADRQLLDAHWGWDIGAADVTRHLVEKCGSVGLLSTHSRLWVDCNREPEWDSWIVREIDGHRLSFNEALNAEEKAVRRREYFDPFHETVDRTIRENHHPDLWLISIHSFTKVYQGQQRDLEIAVLFDTYEEEAQTLGRALAAPGFHVQLNEPYSGKEGLIYSIHRAGTKFGLRCVELEVRQDLVQTKETATVIADALFAALQCLLP